MLSKAFQNNQITPYWDFLQQPTHGSNQETELLRLLSALDDGWQILETADYLAHGSNSEGRGYLLTIYHPKRKISRELSISQSPRVDRLLEIEGALSLGDRIQ